MAWWKVADCGREQYELRDGCGLGMESEKTLGGGTRRGGVRCVDGEGGADIT
jgi:hypothetical protein